MAAIQTAIGQILIDCGFLSQRQIEQALEELRYTNKLLGQVLVRMGILELEGVKSALSDQEHLGNHEWAVRLSAGVR